MDLSEVTCPKCKRRMVPVVCLCERCDVRLEGRFETSPLAQLPPQDQALVIAFMRSHGSIKRIQELLGVSYPTARARLDRIITRLNEVLSMPGTTEEVIGRLHRGEITAREALELLP
ncbi:DUF2089 domain-containing protein [bacterium]|nr:DUF2089 domain-containing protein [candidate division CSSED10-310 bacterium]